MSTCPYCARDKEATRTECFECGMDLRLVREPVRDQSVLSRRLRVALRVIGIGGGLVWFCFGAFLHLFHGVGPGIAPRGMAKDEWALCIATVLATFIYYTIISGRAWTRRLPVVGTAMHTLWFVAVICIVSWSDGGFLLAPLFLAGAVCWIAFAQTTPYANRPS